MIDANGRYVAFKLKTSNGIYTIFNIYAPVNAYERVKLFNDISALLCANDENVETIIGGDYNCTLNNAIDRCNCTSKIDIGQIDLKNDMENCDLEDIWKRRNPDIKQFSWEGRGKIKNRLLFGINVTWRAYRRYTLQKCSILWSQRSVYENSNDKYKNWKRHLENECPNYKNRFISKCLSEYVE